MRRIASAIVFMSAYALLGHAQTSSPDLPVRNRATGIIRGRVLAAGSDTPLRNARVQVASDAGSVSSVFTDGDGQFVVSALVAGQYRLTATKPGYVSTSLAARRFQDPGTPITVPDAAAAGTVDLRL